MVVFCGTLMVNGAEASGISAPRGFARSVSVGSRRQPSAPVTDSTALSWSARVTSLGDLPEVQSRKVLRGQETDSGVAAISR